MPYSCETPFKKQPPKMLLLSPPNGELDNAQDALPTTSNRAVGISSLGEATSPLEDVQDAIPEPKRRWRALFSKS